MSDSNGVGILTSRSSGGNEPHYMLKVESFSVLSEAGIYSFESDIFESGDYRWKLVLYPNGNLKEEGKNHISLYLHIVDTSSLPEGWEVNVYLKFYLYDHVQENYLTFQDADGKKRRFHSTKLIWGFAKLLPLKIFKDTSSGYLFQDSCVFGVEVFVTPKFVVKENCLSMLKPPTTNNSYTWTIDKFSSIDDNLIFSEHFKVGKIKWNLELFPKGDSSIDGTYLSLFLSVADSESLPDDWRIYADFYLCVRSLYGTDHFVKKELGHWFSALQVDWGSHFLISNDLEDDGKTPLLKEDKLTVEVKFASLGVVKSLS